MKELKQGIAKCVAKRKPQEALHQFSFFIFAIGIRNKKIVKTRTVGNAIGQTS